MEPLESAGYMCYWMGHGALTRLSGCHHEAYDRAIIKWSNVACVHAADSWYPVLDAWSHGGLCDAWGSA